HKKLLQLLTCSS
nr:Chain B, Nuclear receptor coactivator 3 [Homo sapiens]